MLVHEDDLLLAALFILFLSTLFATAIFLVDKVNRWRRENPGDSLIHRAIDWLID